jgi:hypothetical protein
MMIDEQHMALIYTEPGEFAFILGVIPIQPRTQALARSILNRYPEIAEFNWQWKKGEGLSCDSEHVKFSAKREELPPAPNYPGIEPVVNVAGARQAGYKTALNPAKKGVEIRFEEKPPQDVIDALKCNGFRWSGKVKCWYSRQSPATIEFAQKMKGAYP